MKLYSFYTISLLVICCHQLLGQDFKFIEAEIRSIQPDGTIYYSDKPMMKIVDAFLQRTKNDTIVGYYDKKLPLNKEEKASILASLKQKMEETLADSVFKNSKRIARDSIENFVHKKNLEVVGPIITPSGKMNTGWRWAFSFTDPIYFKQDSWMIYYICHYANSMGEYGLFVCKKEDNEWVRFASLGGGAW